MFAIFLLALVLSRQSNASPYGDNFHVMADEAGIAFVKFKDVAVAEEKRDIAKRDGEEDELDKMIQEEGSKAEEAPEQANPAPEQTNAGASTENKGGDEDSELEKMIAEEGGKADEGSVKPSNDEASKSEGGAGEANSGGDDAELEKMIAEESGKGGEGNAEPEKTNAEPEKTIAGESGQNADQDEAAMEKAFAEEAATQEDDGEGEPVGGGTGQAPSGGNVEPEKPNAAESNENKGGGGGGGEEDSELDKMMAEEEGKADEGSEKPNAEASNENKGGDEDSELEKLIAEEGAKADEPLIAEEAQDARSNEIEENEHANAEVKKTLAEYIHELELNKELAETDKAAERKVRNEDFYRKYDEVAAVAIEETEDAASGIAVVETAASDVDAPPAIVTTANPSKTEASFFLKKY